VHGVRSLNRDLKERWLERNRAAEVLERYAQRGVFRSFSQTAPNQFHFQWLWNLPFRLTFDAARCAWRFPNLLPDIPRGSPLETELKAALRAICAADRPEHRRIDARRLSVRYSNRRGTVSLSFVVLRGDYGYGVKKAIGLVNELFVGFLNVHHPDYMAGTFHLCPPE